MFRLLILLLIVLAVAGWALDWFTFEKGTNEDGKTKIEIVLDDDKIDQDTAKAKEKVSELAGKASDNFSSLAADGSFEGTVDGVDAAEGRLTVRGADGELVEFRIDGDVKVKRDGDPASLDDVVPGETARVLYEDEDGGRRATRVLLGG
ncbi:MAG: hypothetical protein ACF8XB_25305 [Planctomycetota bacterium JB042]